MLKRKTRLELSRVDGSDTGKGREDDISVSSRWQEGSTASLDRPKVKVGLNV